jgi:nicotinate-nucleotide adenylyltransferase
MRIGVFGGTFDPVHYGHLILAEQCREQGRLDQVWFVPAPRPPQKEAQALTRFDARVEMLQLAVAGNPAFRIDEIEKDRPGPSYTVDTLAELRQRHPGADWHLLVGADALADLPGWREPRRLLEQAGLLVMARSGTPLLSADELRARVGLPGEVLLRLQVIEAPLVEIASRDLRRRAATGRSLRYFLPRAVECYIHDKRLYAPTPARRGGEDRPAGAGESG